MHYMSSTRYKLKLTIHFFNDLIYNIKEKLNLMIKEKISLYKTSYSIRHRSLSRSTLKSEQTLLRKART